jgi:3-oxoacyl-[acyl-carrier-protein] synthase-1
MQVKHYIEITPTSVIFDGQPVATQETGEKMLVELYRRYAGDYPKFFKMDTLCRLGFVAAEILLQNETADTVILANHSASIKNDTDYMATISDGNYYPSPALFVYTLPNIVTGEIAIRHHIQGETSFYILDTPEQLDPIIRATLTANQSPLTVLAGWCECSEANRFYAKLQLIWNN